MCNIYKNNLIILSQLEESALLYYDQENQLHTDNRYLSYFRSGTKESKIGYIIKNSFLQIFNCYIINLVSQEIQKETNPDSQLLEIENSKHLLRKSLEGLQTYYESLVQHQLKYNNIEIINKELKEIFENIDEYKLEYLLTIDTPNETYSESKSWLYQLYESTIKSSPKKNIPKIKITEDELDLDSTNDEENESPKINSLDLKNECETDDIITEQPQLGDYFPDELEDNNEDSPMYFIQGMMYIISKKIVNIFFTIGKHVSFYFH